MNKKNLFLCDVFGKKTFFDHFVIIVKTTTILLFTCISISVAETTYTQDSKVSLNKSNVKLKAVLEEIENQTDNLFTYNNELNVNETAQQQEKIIKGKVTDINGESLPGVTIIIKGAAQGTSSDIDGNFSLSGISENDVLQFSYVGMQTQEIVIGSRANVNITMIEDAIGLEEFVAVGYGAMQRNKISTAITSVKPDNIKSQLNNSLDRALEGQVAGMDIKQNSGTPGGGAVMRIRGSSSLQGRNSPLIVIDGVPMQDSYNKEHSPLAFIDQRDIENIEVLKDVSATSIYGSRGSNGVILITTKSGEVGKTELTVNLSTGVSKILPSERMPLMNAEEFARWRKEDAFDRAAYLGQNISIDDIPEAYRNPEDWKGKGTDWQDVIMRIAPTMKFNVNVSHGTDKFTGYFSMGYSHEEGIVKETNFKRLNMRANMDFRPNNFLNIGMNISPVISWWGNRTTTESGGASKHTVIGTAITAPPTDGPYLDDYPHEELHFFDGKWDTNIKSPGTFNFDNPLYRLKNEVDKSQQFNLIMQPYIQISPIKDLVFRSQLNLQLTQNDHEFFKPSTVLGKGYGAAPPRPIEGFYNTSKRFNWQFENTLNYHKKVNDHLFDVLAGYTMEHYNNYSSQLYGYDYPGDEVKTLNAATSYNGSSSESNWSLISGILRLNYDFKTRYLLTTTIRRDGSSRFGTKNKWGYFPSVAIGWNMSKENFFPETELVTNLKLRASYGTSGNNNIGNYTWIPNMGISNYNTGGSIADGKYVSSLENPYLGWEKAKEANIGLDVTLLKGRFNLVMDVYNKLTTGMLWNVSLPYSSGYGSFIENIGEVRNRGLEILINSENIRQKDFRWETDFNISFNRNKVMNLGNVDQITSKVSHSGEALITKVGQPMGMFYGWITAGVFLNEAETEQFATIPGGQFPGTVRWEDQNGDGIIDVNDKVIMGNPHPDFRGGMNNRIYYKDWDFNMSLTYAHNFDVYASLESTSLNLDGVFNVLKDVKNRWRSPEEPGDGRMPTTMHQTYLDRDLPQSKFVYNSSFIKIQNISLGYTFSLPSIKQIRLSLSVQNPFLITNYKYGNPDVDVTGNSNQPNYDEFDYPLGRIFELGLSTTF